MRRIAGERTRVVLLAGLGVLAVICLIAVAPRMLGSRGGADGAGPSPSGDPTAPDDWGRHGGYLDPADAYPPVVRIVGADGGPFCTGSVVHSPAGDLVMTAAHCVYANDSYVTGSQVVPGADGSSGGRPAWQVRRIWVDTHYTSGHDDRYDYAFLQVTRSGGPSIESAVGADTLRVDQPYTLPDVTTTGYPDQGDPSGEQLTCTMETYRSAAHPQYREMHCGGYTAGVSGSPWVLLRHGARTGELVGLIGGYDGGGPPDGTPHEDAISYSPYFTEATLALYRQAAAGTGGAAGS